MANENEEAIKILKVILEEATETEDSICYVTSGDADALKAAIQALEQMESSSEKPNKSEILTGWIPVSERLPEKEGKYLVTTFGGGMYDVDTSHFFIWEDGETEWGEYGVEAWMPLPEPYKEESEE